MPHSTFSMLPFGVLMASIASPACAHGSGDAGGFPDESPVVSDANAPNALSVDAAAESSSYGADDAGGPPAQGATIRVPVPVDDAGEDGSSLADDASYADSFVDADDIDAAADGPSPWGTAPVLPAIGDLILTEIMFNPSGPVPEAQWFEVYNSTATPELLNGLTIEDGWGDVHVIASATPVVAPPESYVLLVRDVATALASALPSVPIVYEYGAGLSSDEGIELAWDETGDLSLSNGHVELADVPYGPWGISWIGASIELGPVQYATASEPQSWCVAAYPWAAFSDNGTPGAGNDCP